ncbi:FAD-dependent oxidoreductase [Sinorhizobium sp. 7-81]|uniref:FAD-dependent oxidoreductase n=1 Tax=Sinorhizobium sp. 8-89 TaxID=3049089 RepID=UPI0024C3C6EB|nr:FAD-dependent oxidoreductase [Sinorhizobium sp. 8-89]MDK1490704.1 FAD-dependent oxidoreductase [Sinorhizobium sp. 8-89]
MASIGIVGSGIIGCASAAHLIAECHETTVFEKDISGLPASVGNAGSLADLKIDPPARPDMLFAAPKWLMDVADLLTTGENIDLAPFSIRRFQ